MPGSTGKDDIIVDRQEPIAAVTGSKDKINVEDDAKGQMQASSGGSKAKQKDTAAASTPEAATVPQAARVEPKINQSNHNKAEPGSSKESGKGETRGTSDATAAATTNDTEVKDSGTTATAAQGGARPEAANTDYRSNEVLKPNLSTTSNMIPCSSNDADAENFISKLRNCSNSYNQEPSNEIRIYITMLYLKAIDIRDGYAINKNDCEHLNNNIKMTEKAIQGNYKPRVLQELLDTVILLVEPEVLMSEEEKLRELALEYMEKNNMKAPAEEPAPTNPQNDSGQQPAGIEYVPNIKQPDAIVPRRDDDKQQAAEQEAGPSCGKKVAAVCCLVLATFASLISSGILAYCRGDVLSRGVGPPLVITAVDYIVAFSFGAAAVLLFIVGIVLISGHRDHVKGVNSVVSGADATPIALHKSQAAAHT